MISKNRKRISCVWWILILLLFLLGIGRLYLFIADKLGTKNKNV